MQDVSVFQDWYGVPHTASEAQAQAVYGLPEVNRGNHKNSRLVANPGCYTTCSILALLPVLKNKLVRSSGIVIDAKSGVTGAGPKSDTGYSFCELEGNFQGVFRHPAPPYVRD